MNDPGYIAIVIAVAILWTASGFWLCWRYKKEGRDDWRKLTFFERLTFVLFVMGGPTAITAFMLDDARYGYGP